MSNPTGAPIPRCCPAHRDWVSLAQHLLADFSDVPPRAIIDELAQAKNASEFFHLEHADALDCAELIVRHRVLIATCRMPSTTSTAPPVTIAQVA